MGTGRSHVSHILMVLNKQHPHPIIFFFFCIVTEFPVPGCEWIGACNASSSSPFLLPLATVWNLTLSLQETAACAKKQQKEKMKNCNKKSIHPAIERIWKGQRWWWGVFPWTEGGEEEAVAVEWGQVPKGSVETKATSHPAGAVFQQNSLTFSSSSPCFVLLYLLVEEFH